MRTRISRVLIVAAALAAGTVGLITTSASANTAGAAPTGAITLTPSPATGAQLTTLNIAPPAGAACAGDTAAGGYRWQTFFTNAADPNVLTFNASGPLGGPAGTINFPLFSSTGSPIVNQGTAAVTGVLVGFPASYSLGVLSAQTVTSGSYFVGFACTVGGVSDRLWFSPVTVVAGAGNLGVASITFGATPGAPVLSGLTSTLTSCSVTIAAPAATPTATAISLVATPTAPLLAGAVTVTVPLAATATSGTASGLVAGQTYNLTATQTNTVGTSAVSNTLACTASVQVAPPNVIAAPGASSVVVTWTAAGTPTSFTITAAACASGTTALNCTLAGGTAIAGSPFTFPAGTTSNPFSGLTAGQLYVFQVQPNYAAGTSSPATVAFAAALANTLIIQDLSVTRPAGALVLTQRCGVYGGMGPETVPGFGTIPGDVGVGVDPATGVSSAGTAPTLGQLPGGAADPNFPVYPYPVDANGVPTIVNYPTHCGVNLGIGKLITTGPLAGEYFTAVGRINQVTVVDTRDSNSAWGLNGVSSAFSSASDSFSGDYLGWQTLVTNTSGVTLAGYDQVVTAGPTVNPSSASTLAGAGLASSRTAASAIAGQGLGIATIDGRLKLLIPLTAKNGTYTATLTFNVI